MYGTYVADLKSVGRLPRRMTACMHRSMRRKPLVYYSEVGFDLLRLLVRYHMLSESTIL